MTALFLAALFLSAVVACGGRSSAKGAGPEVNACAGYEAYDALAEPEADDPSAVAAWAAGVLRVIERTDVERDITDKQDKRQPVPVEVTAAFDSLKRAVTAFRDRVSAAAEQGPASVAEVSDGLALDTEFRDADRALRAFHARTCP